VASAMSGGIDLKSKLPAPSQYTNLTILKPSNSPRKDTDKLKYIEQMQILNEQKEIQA
jgi:hypothetical protein